MKPGFKTTEFWLALAATMVAGFFASDVTANGVAMQAAGVAGMALTAAGYAAVRAWAKGPDGKPGYKTTEFWLSFAAVAVGALQASGVFLEAGVAGKVLGLGAMLLGALGYQVSRAFVKRPAA